MNGSVLKRGIRASVIAGVVLAGMTVLPTAAQAEASKCEGVYGIYGNSNSFTATCYNATHPYDQFRAKLTCIRASHPSVTVYGPWKPTLPAPQRSTAVCASSYEPGNGTWVFNN